MSWGQVATSHSYAQRRSCCSGLMLPLCRGILWQRGPSVLETRASQNKFALGERDSSYGPALTTLLGSGMRAALVASLSVDGKKMATKPNAGTPTLDAQRRGEYPALLLNGTHFSSYVGLA